MKILLFGEYSGFFNNLKDGLVKQGHQVFLASGGDSYKNYPSDFRWDINYKLGKFNRIMDIANILSHKKYFMGYDIVLLMAPDLITKYTLPNKLVYNFLRRNNDKVYLIGAGETPVIFDYWFDKKDAKYYNYMSGYLENLKHPEKFKYNNNESLRKWENDLINSIEGYIPIWYEYAQPFREHPKLKKTIPIPINLDEFKYKHNIIHKKIVFFHGLSTRAGKGGKYIIEAFDQLRTKHSNIAEFICAGDLPFSDYIKLIDKANVVLDDTNSYSLGMNALFSMAKGKVVMGGAEAIANQELDYNFNPAFNLNSDINQIKQHIEYLIENKSDIEKIGHNSRKFVEESHNNIFIAQKYIDLFTRNKQ